MYIHMLTKDTYGYDDIAPLDPWVSLVVAVDVGANVKAELPLKLSWCIENEISLYLAFGVLMFARC